MLQAQLQPAVRRYDIGLGLAWDGKQEIRGLSIHQTADCVGVVRLRAKQPVLADQPQVSRRADARC
jgi:hypothetical protein